MRVGQHADVEHVVGVERNAALEREALEDQRQPAVVGADSSDIHVRLQLRRRAAALVSITCETLAQIGEQLALELDRIDQRAALVGAGLEPRPGRLRQRVRRRVSEKRRTSVSVVASRNSGRTGDAFARAARCSCWRARAAATSALRTSMAIATRRSSRLRSSCDEVAQQLGRQVVDAEEAGVLERVQRHRFARARHAGDEDDSRALMAAWQAVAAALPALAPEHFLARARALVPDEAFAAQHARDLGHALPRPPPARRCCAAPACSAVLGHDQVVVGAGGDLRQVRDGEHLAVAPELLHQPAHRLGDGAADAGVDLVEDQRRAAVAERGWCVTAIASAMRDSSPPEATLPTGRGVLPACPATRNSTLRGRTPAAASVRARSATSKRPPCMPSPASPA